MTDHLALHLKTDRILNWNMIEVLQEVAPKASNKSDGHLVYVRQVDAAHSTLRGQQMTHALAAVREIADSGACLDWTGLQQLHALAIGATSQQFRSSTALAKGGMETYGYHPELQKCFETRMLVHQDPVLHPFVRAARAYLDICFFHPFPDGNARLARLVLEFILRRNALQLCDARPVFSFERFAGRPEQYIGFVKLMAVLCCSRERVCNSQSEW